MPTSSYTSASPRRRALGIALAVAAHLLVLLIMLTMAPKLLPPNREPTAFTTFDVPKPAPVPGAKVVAKPEKKEEKSASGAAGRAPTPETPAAPPKPPTPEMPELIGGMDMFHAADVAKLDRRGEGTAGDSKGKDSGSAYGPGEGPGGQRLYNAEWEREPTRAEMATYLAQVKAEAGSALIACQTIPGNRVENCRSLGETPVGSGFGRALRLAAWQFRVRPPRVGGQPQIGAWVRIRYDLIRGVVK